MNIPHLRSALLVCLPLAAVGCANPSHLMLYQQSNLGVNAGISPATNNLHVRVGLRREFGAIIPKYYDSVPKVGADGAEVVDKDGKVVTGQKREAASSFVAARMRVRSAFETPEITECLASGTAAIQAAGGNGLPSFVTALANVTSATATPAPAKNTEAKTETGN